METKFNFKSDICTSREQSEKLLALGLSKETADMCHTPFRSKVDGETLEYTEHCSLPHGKDIPAWSLHRLIEMIEEVCPQVVIIFHRVDIRSNVKRIAYSFDVCDNLYDNLIDCIEWLIKGGYFNKEYLA
jgi:hypothetical protein